MDEKESRLTLRSHQNGRSVYERSSPGMASPPSLDGQNALRSSPDQTSRVRGRDQVQRRYGRETDDLHMFPTAVRLGDTTEGIIVHY